MATSSQRIKQVYSFCYEDALDVGEEEAQLLEAELTFYSVLHSRPIASLGQITADAFGVPVVALATSEGAGLGAAIQAAFAYFRSAGSEVAYKELCTVCVDLDEKTRCEPDEGRRDQYGEQLDKQLELTRTLHRAGLL